MDQDQAARTSVASVDDSQKQLFSSEAIERAGKPSFISIADPNRPTRRRTLGVASAVMRELVALLELAAPTSGTILLQGESGSGKNLLANLVHQRSLRKDGPFVQFSAGHHPEGLVESELFGHEEGAYTGARGSRPGKCELADKGTLFIDEIGDLAPQVQLKLHRFLDDQILERVGGSNLKVVDVRIVAATHRDLWALVKEGKFREDLFYRLSVVCVRVPALRERVEEIPLIARSLLDELSERHAKPWLAWEEGAVECLCQIAWPGNVRELRNAIERMVILARSDTLGMKEIMGVLASQNGTPRTTNPNMVETRRLRFLEVFKSCAGNRSAMAKALGTSRSQVRRMIDRYCGIENEVDQSH